MLEDEFVVDELEQPSRMEGPTTYVYEVLDVVSGDLSAVHLVNQDDDGHTLQSQAWA